MHHIISKLSVVFWQGIVIIGTVISTATVMVILYKKWQKASFDLTTMKHTQKETCVMPVHHIDYDNEADNTHEAIKHSISDVNNIPLEQNAAYIVKSPIMVARNVAYENASKFYEYK